MKQNTFRKAAASFALAGLMAFGTVVSVAASPVISRTDPGNSVEHTLGGVPASVRKMVYADCVFYLADGVTDSDFEAVIALGSKPLVLHTFNNGPLYSRPLYILWNGEKTELLVHPLFYSSDVEAMEAVSVPTLLPVSLGGDVKATQKAPLTAEQEYMLTEEYTEAVRAEFYRLLNEHRTANGLPELEINLELQDYADIRASEQRQRAGHERPDGSAAGSGWYDSRNVIESRYAENAVPFGRISADVGNTARGIFSLWKNSPGHNRHMLWDFEPGFTMAFGFHPEPDDYGRISSGGIFATGY